MLVVLELTHSHAAFNSTTRKPFNALVSAPQAQGWSLDAASYTTAFRVRVAATPGRSAADVAALRASVPAGLACAGNLGSVDLYPATSGKAAAAAYLLQRWGLPPDQAVLLCDDDNDLELAAQVIEGDGWRA